MTHPPGAAERLSHPKISASHLDRLAVVYIRQSTLGQVHHHQESTRLQYALVDYAGSLAVGRPGFVRLVTEVTLNHVGVILGIEMSRLARSNKDWHHLLEVCGLFQTLIADTDGLYNPTEYNDRLLLGLKGTLSEAELHLLKNRLHQGKLSKARRGELGVRLPIGYVRAADGRVQLDPDEQVQHVVRLIFRKFTELGTLNAVLNYLVTHQIQLGVREASRADARLAWRRPNRMTLQNLLHHPIYAGVYAYGRRQTDARKKQPGRASTGRVCLPPGQWHALLRDHVPAYISWEQYQDNQARLAANRNVAANSGAPRRGAGLLAGLLVCGRCGRRMSVRYSRERVSYTCTRMAIDYGGPACFHCAGPPLEQWVVAQLLEALTPASLTLSWQTLAHLEEERAALEQLWQHRLERSGYEAERAARQYRAVEPEHRLVARSLERAWEEALSAQRALQEDYERFRQQSPRTLTPAEVQLVEQLARDLPALWFAPTTTMQERKEILRLVIDRIVVHPQTASEQLRVDLHWCGGHVTLGRIIRPIARLERLTYYPELCRRVKQGVQAGKPAQQIAEQLNAEGYRPAKRRTTWTPQQVRRLAAQLGCPFAQRADGRRLPAPRPPQAGDWWTRQGLALSLEMPSDTLYSWIRRGEVTTKREPQDGTWRVWADEAERARLRAKRAHSPGRRSHDAWVARAQQEQLGPQEVRDG